MVTASGLPLTSTSISLLAPVIVVLGASGVAAATVAPADAWVTLIEWAPTESPAPAVNEARPSADPPDPMRIVPEATTSSFDATVPWDIWVDPVAN